MKYFYLIAVIYLFILSGCTINEVDTGKIDLEGSSDSLELFAEYIISTNLNERDMAISPQGDEFFYSIFSYDNSIRVLMHVTMKDDKWKEPEIASFAGEYFDLEPVFSPDGQKLFFVSNRPLTKNDSTQDHNIWFVTRDDSGWTSPRALSTVINTGQEEFYPSVSSNGNLYFTARYADALGGEDIYLSKFIDGEYQAPIRLDTAVNSVNWEFNAYVSPDEKYLIFSSFGRADGQGGGDLYICRKDSDNNWLPARNMGDLINSEKLDYCPFIDWPRNTFYFTSNRGPKPEKINSLEDLKKLAKNPMNGMGNIYRINLAAIKMD